MHSTRVGLVNASRAASAYFGLTNSGTSPAVRSSAGRTFCEEIEREGGTQFLVPRARARIECAPLRRGDRQRLRAERDDELVAVARVRRAPVAASHASPPGAAPLAPQERVELVVLDVDRHAARAAGGARARRLEPHDRADRVLRLARGAGMKLKSKPRVADAPSAIGIWRNARPFVSWKKTAHLTPASRQRRAMHRARSRCTSPWPSRFVSTYSVGAGSGATRAAASSSAGTFACLSSARPLARSEPASARAASACALARARVVRVVARRRYGACTSSGRARARGASAALARRPRLPRARTPRGARGCARAYAMRKHAPSSSRSGARA